MKAQYLGRSSEVEVLWSTAGSVIGNPMVYQLRESLALSYAIANLRMQPITAPAPWLHPFPPPDGCRNLLLPCPVSRRSLVAPRHRNAPCLTSATEHLYAVAGCTIRISPTMLLASAWREGDNCMIMVPRLSGCFTTLCA